MPSGFSQKNVLDNQAVQLGQRRACMVLVGVAHGRVLAHDVHAADFVLVDRVHDLDDRQALVGV